MKISRLLSRTTALAALTVVGAGVANAQSITPVFISALGSAGNVAYTYQLFSTADTKTQAGDVFTFYDFNGLLTGGGNAPTFTAGQAGIAYTISVQNLGLNPPGFTPPVDDPTQPNVSLTYTGSTFTNTGSGSQLLGTVVLHSAFTQNVGGDFTPFAASSTKNSNSTPAANQGNVTGPNSGPPPTPEPGTWAMLVGMSVTGLAAARRRRRK